jgi:hypothetical protein
MATLAHIPRASIRIAVHAKPGFLRNCRYGEADIEKQVFNERDSPAFTMSLCGRFDTAQLEDCFLACLRCGHARAQVVVNMHPQMAVEFIGTQIRSASAKTFPPA